MALRDIKVAHNNMLLYGGYILGKSEDGFVKVNQLARKSTEVVQQTLECSTSLLISFTKK